MAKSSVSRSQNKPKPKFKKPYEGFPLTAHPAARHDILDFLRENSPLAVCGSGIRRFLMIWSSASADVAGLLQESRCDSNVTVSMLSVI